MFSTAAEEKSILSERVIIMDRILYACSDRVPHLKESIKDYVLRTSTKLLQSDKRYKRPKWDRLEKIFEEELTQLLLEKMILESPRTGRYFTNDRSRKVLDWYYKSIDKEDDSRDIYFQADEERLWHVDYVPFKGKHRRDTDLLDEDKKQMIVSGSVRAFVTVIEVVDEQIFFARNKNNKVLPYCFHHLSLMELKEF